MRSLFERSASSTEPSSAKLSSQIRAMSKQGSRRRVFPSIAASCNFFLALREEVRSGLVQRAVFAGVPRR